MNVVQVINYHRYGGGLDNMANATIALLKTHGVNVFLLSRDSGKLSRGLRSKLYTFICSIYSPSGLTEINKILQANSIDIVHIHEVYPLISAWILRACRDANVPVVFTCHDYRLTCPIYTHWHKDEICRKCIRGHNYWCVFNNCRGKIFESIAYWLHGVVAQRFRLFQENVTLFVAVSEFMKNWLAEAEFPNERIVVVPNMVEDQDSFSDTSHGEYIAYAGRICSEKGFDLLLSASRELRIPLHIAGDYSKMNDVVKTSPEHVKFLGMLDKKQLNKFYQNARFLVVPSRFHEPFGLVAAEAMMYGLPVIASMAGGLAEVVEDGVTGLLFKPGNAEDLSKKIKLLWENPNLCKQFGIAGREKAIREYSPEKHYNRLMAVYERAIEINKTN
jgi:glycosyltransferase involved in cell wall biosynthesis